MAMFDKRLDEIVLQQQQEHDFFDNDIKSALNELEQAANPRDVRDKIEELLLNTSFEHVLDNADELIYDERESSQRIAEEFNRQCTATLRHNDHQRIETVDALIKTHPSLQLKPRALFCLSSIYSHGDRLEDHKLAYIYADKARKSHAAAALKEKILEQVAKTYDRLQLSKIPAAPQKYGTIHADHDHPVKGWKKYTLIPPYKGYIYNKLQLNTARQQLGIKPLEEQEKQLRLALRSGAMKMSALTKQNNDTVQKNHKAKLKQNALVCSNCKEPGHGSGSCIKPRKTPL